MLYVPKSTFFMGVLEVKVYYISNCFARGSPWGIPWISPSNYNQDIGCSNTIAVIHYPLFHIGNGAIQKGLP